MEPNEFAEPFSHMFRDLIEEGQLLYDSLGKVMREPWRGRTLAIEIVNDLRLNAYAATVDDNYLIRINQGVFRHIYGTAYGLFCCPEFMPSIGDSLREKGPSIRDHRFAPMPLTESADAINVPNDQVRGTIAHMVGDVASHFILYHEIGHIVGGHLEVVDASSIAESGMRWSSTSEALFRQVLECDADAFACHVSSDVLMPGQLATEVQRLMKSETWEPAECAFIAYLTGVAVLFRLLCPDAPANVGTANGSHPHPAVRDFMVGVCAFARGVGRQQITIDALNDLLSKSVMNVERTWSDLGLAGQATAASADWAQDVRSSADVLFAEYAARAQFLDGYSHVPRQWHDWDWPETYE